MRKMRLRHLVFIASMLAVIYAIIGFLPFRSIFITLPSLLMAFLVVAFFLVSCIHIIFIDVLKRSSPRWIVPTLIAIVLMMTLTLVGFSIAGVIARFNG